MGCGCKGGQQTPPQPTQTVQTTQSSGNGRVQNTIQESVRQVVEKYYKRRS